MLGGLVATFLTAGPLFLGQEGFGLFSSAHLAWIGVCVAIVMALVHRYMHLPTGTRWGSPRRRMLVAVAGVPLVLLATEILLMVLSGVFWPTYWPLHLCSFAEYFCLWHALAPNRVNRELAFFFGLTGGSCAILFANWSYCPWWAWVTICDFVQHALICAFALMAEVEIKTSSSWWDMPFSIVFAGIYVVVFRWLNPLLGTDFGFVNGGSAGSPLEVWEQAFGNPGYLVVYAIVSLGVLVTLHLFVELRRRMATPA